MWLGVGLYQRYFPLQRGKVRLAAFGKDLFRLPTLCATFDVDKKIHVNLGDFIEDAIFQRQIWEPEITRAVERLVRPGDVVLDVGAHIGYYTLLVAKRVGPRGAVHSFEPVPSLFRRLQANVSLNRQGDITTLNNVAVCDKEGKITMYLPRIANSGLGSPWLDASRRLSDPIEVDAVDLDSYVATTGIRAVNFIKMDIEGGEFSALRGARSLLEENSPDIVSELNPVFAEAAGYHVQDVVDFMKYLGYEAFSFPYGEEATHCVYFSRQPRISLPRWDPGQYDHSGISSERWL